MSTVLAQLNETYSGVAAVALLFLHVLAIVSVVRGKGTTGHKLAWTAAIVLLPVLGLVLYVLFGRSSRDRPLLE